MKTSNNEQEQMFFQEQVFLWSHPFYVVARPVEGCLTDWNLLCDYNLI